MNQKDIEKHKASLKAQFTRNLVAKNSRNKSGAGSHTSDKDYNRYEKEYENDALSYIELTEQIELLKAQQAAGVNLKERERLQYEINELQDQLKEL